VRRIVVLGRGGNDSVVINPAVTIPLFFSGGAGDDSALAGGGDDVLLGGPGSDSLFGDPQRDRIRYGAGGDHRIGTGTPEVPLP
jgi:Ca2+-binding RTX toxin-like protein